MKRSHQYKEAPCSTSKGLSDNVAIHEAGHAAAIVLGNKRKRLPPVFFQVSIKTLEGVTQGDKYLLSPGSAFIAEVDGGRFIPMLPSSFIEATQNFSPAQKLAYQRAFEADMVNLLVGPLAEAKYIAHIDGESFNPLLVDIYALPNYGGCYDLATFFSYLDCYLNNEALREEKITALYLETFNFVISRSNWQAITALAVYLAGSDQPIFDCNEMIDILNKAHSGYASTRSGEWSPPVTCVT
jgi:hypothetical protein